MAKRNSLAVQRLPVPEKLEVQIIKRSLMTSVRRYFYALWNGADAAFRNFLGTVNDADAVTGKRMFDRHNAVLLIKKVATEAKDVAVAEAVEGDIDRCLTQLMRTNNMGLKLRRQQYAQLTHSPAPAE